MLLKHAIELLILSALWGASFLFMKIAVPEFGAFALVMLRSGIAALSLLPLMIWYKKLPHFKRHYKRILIVALISTAIPFVLLSYSTLYLSAGLASILNATTPFYTAIIAWLWVNDQLHPIGIMGLLIGFIGVIILMFDTQINANEISLIAALCALSATFFYGLGINFSSQKLKGIDPITLAFGSQLFASLFLFPLGIITWPTTQPNPSSWQAIIVLGVLCTGLAFILFFRLIAEIGSNKTATVTYLIPFFGVICGIFFLNETLTHTMLLGGILIMTGVIFSTQSKRQIGFVKHIKIKKPR